MICFIDYIFTNLGSSGSEEEYKYQHQISEFQHQEQQISRKNRRESVQEQNIQTKRTLQTPSIPSNDVMNN